MVSGDEALVDEQTYEHYRAVKAGVLSRVSLVRAKSPWAFFCLAAGSGGAPRLVLLPSLVGAPALELDAVSAGLRERLTDQTEDLAMNDHAEELLRRFLELLGRADRQLLSRRKQRALEEMERVVDHFQKEGSKTGERETVDRLHVLLQALRSKDPERQPDWDEIATRWLDIIRPIWYERLKGRRQKPLLLKDIRKDLYSRRKELVPKLIEHFARFPVQPPPDERVRACIIGVD